MALRSSVLLILTVYFIVNLSLSTSNKIVLESTPTPWLLTCQHAVFTTAGCLVCLQRGYFTLSAELSSREHLTLLVFSVLFTVNIAMSNVSLSLVSLAFHQVARSTGPVLTLLLYGIWFRRLYSLQIWLAVAATTVGVCLVTYGDYSCTLSGAFLTFLGMILATVKTVATNQLLTGNLRFHPFELLLRMCPLAAAQAFICAYLSGELAVFQKTIQAKTPSSSIIRTMIVNGLLAFAQNVVSFQTNKVAGALTIAVCANLKQLCTVLLSIRIFGTVMTKYGALGVPMAFFGTSYYSWTVARDRQKIQNNTRAVDPISREEKQIK